MEDLSKSIWVSVVMATYNHEKYIRKAIEGVLMQKTDFLFELIIAEDFSTDITRKIALEYANKYPQLIKLLDTNENLGIVKNYIRAVQITSGKYIAFCEGDDYWTDILKLQKQVDFLESNVDCSLCYHKTQMKTANDDNKDDFFGAKGIDEPTKFNLEEFITSNNGIGIRTPSMMIRSEIVLSAPNWLFQAPLGDLSIQLYSGLKGKYGYLPFEMAVYNRGNIGAWSENNHTVEWRIKQIRDLNKTYNLFDDNTNYKYNNLIKKRNEDWIKGRIDYVQRNFKRIDQFKMIRKHYKILLFPNKRNLLFWMRFIFGYQLIERFFEIKNK